MAYYYLLPIFEAISDTIAYVCKMPTTLKPECVYSEMALDKKKKNLEDKERERRA